MRSILPPVLTGERWVVTAPFRSELERFTVDPAAIGRREIAVATTYSAVSSGTEAAIYTATDDAVHRPDGWCRYPCDMGYSGVGRVVAIGDDVTEYEVGTRVIGLLGHASHWTMDVDRMLGPEWSNRPLARVAPDVDDRAAAFIRIAGIAMTATQLVRRADYGVVGVWGLGIVGIMVAQLLKCAGQFIVGIDPNPVRRELANQVGLDATLDPTSPNFTDELAAFAPGGLATAVDTVGIGAVTVSIPSRLQMRGELVLMTHWRHPENINASAFIEEIFSRGISVHGGLEYGPGSRPWQNWAQLQINKWDRIGRLIVSGRLAIDELVTLVAQPDEHATVYGILADGSPKHLGILIDWTTAA